VNKCQYYDIKCYQDDYRLATKGLSYTPVNCELRPNCYYKQLQKAKAEISIQKKTGEFCQDCKTAEQYETITAERDRYKKALEKVKNLLNNFNNMDLDPAIYNANEAFNIAKQSLEEVKE